MELTYECPSCGAIGHVSPVESTPVATCRVCSRSKELHPRAFEAGNLHACAWCATDELYLQKDFPQGLGLAIVVAGFVVSTVFWYYDMPIPALSVLLVSALVDMVLYRVVPNVTICYRCLGQYRGTGVNPEHRFGAFDLAIGERYRQERIRAEQLRARQASADSPPS
jgi:hypothetical protein